ncbi:MAG TPA: protein kinase [Rhodanobacteraceae bacterium]|nr:protein kinase [Rhodanobacteraceae bacterium]
MKTRLGHYDIVAELGRGGMGVVYKGHESSLNRYVAIKVLADALAHDEAVKERFLREARSMAALNDPHIIQIYFIGEDEGQTYFSMEFVDGESLGAMLRRERTLSVESAAKVIYQTGLGLGTAHDHGVIHRDIKPGNLMIGSRGLVKIADFGIALSNQDISKKLTSTGEFVGTPGYLSPEVCLGKPVDQRSDIFSLGIVLFEMLVGRMPFTDLSPLGLMLEVVKAEIPDVRELNQQVDPLIAAVLAKMIAKEPTDRYQSCQELCAALMRHPLVAKGGPIREQPRISPAAATLVGQRTPSSVTLPQPVAPPALPVAAAAAQSRAAPTHRTARESPTTAGAKRPGSAWPWAVAAILLLAGAAYAYRAHIPMLEGLHGNVQISASNAATGTPMIAANLADSAPAKAAEPSGATAGTSGQTEAPPLPMQPAGASAGGDNAGPAQAGTATPTHGAGSGGTETAAQTSIAQTAADDAPPVRIAKATAPRHVVPPKPHVPTIAIMSGGDDAITGPAQDAVSRMLQNRGFRVIEGGHIDGDRPNLRALAGRADAVVFVHARAVGSQEMTYYGQSSTLYTVQLGVKSYAVSDAHLLGSSRAEQVNFTSLNAADKARETITPMLDGVAHDLAAYRAKERDARS